MPLFHEGTKCKLNNNYVENIAELKNLVNCFNYQNFKTKIFNPLA